ncbi:isocitrate lyase/phosphoenolpyruvate mutase family protein, partial [Candidatus Peregrinibacteria bacterium]|nr:isocitrate lyase/phosphoenolpyruvate mutase family protein [Candidatus Peregrinibacteria bacterium]
IQIEDQVSPKKCGHELGREIVEIDEMVARLRAAIDGRRNPQTLIIARTDSRTTHGLAEAIRRAHAYASAGADVIFVESPESEDEFREVARAVQAPLLANMVENGRSPYLPWQRLEELGFKIAIYPGSTVRAAVRTVQTVLAEIRDNGCVEHPEQWMLTLEQYHDVLHFKEYLARETAYRHLSTEERHDD